MIETTFRDVEIEVINKWIVKIAYIICKKSTCEVLKRKITSKINECLNNLLDKTKKMNLHKINKNRKDEQIVQMKNENKKNLFIL